MWAISTHIPIALSCSTLYELFSTHDIQMVESIKLIVFVITKPVCIICALVRMQLCTS